MIAANAGADRTASLVAGSFHYKTKIHFLKNVKRCRDHYNKAFKEGVGIAVCNTGRADGI